MKRRDFISKSVLASGAFTIIPGHLMGRSAFLSANDRINLGFIGVGKQSLDVVISLHKKASGFFNIKLCIRATDIVLKTIKNG